MEKFIKRYHGAAIYEVLAACDSGQVLLYYRVVAKGILPGSGNLMVDFIEQSGTREEAVQKVEQDIDQYLIQHKISRFLDGK